MGTSPSSSSCALDSEEVKVTWFSRSSIVLASWIGSNRVMYILLESKLGDSNLKIIQNMHNDWIKIQEVNRNVT
ncbi:hypothetical protein Leryth_027215 [Lithospermum erythrorhizon]|nr:hypothetical protein Leryth_027215 [Lithospermum erythrorhizon]